MRPIDLIITLNLVADNVVQLNSSRLSLLIFMASSRNQSGFCIGQYTAWKLVWYDLRQRPYREWSGRLH